MRYTLILFILGSWVLYGVAKAGSVSCTDTGQFTYCTNRVTVQHIGNQEIINSRPSIEPMPISPYSQQQMPTLIEPIQSYPTYRPDPYFYQPYRY